MNTGGDISLQGPGAKKPCTVLGGGSVVPPGLRVQAADESSVMSSPPEPTSSMETMTSKDYYFDSYSHFGEFRVHILLLDHLSPVVMPHCLTTPLSRYS